MAWRSSTNIMYYIILLFAIIIYGVHVINGRDCHGRSCNMWWAFVVGGACELAGSRAGSSVGVMDARAGRGGSLTCTRQQHTATDFISYYETLCAVQSSCPVSSVRAAAKEGVLNCQVYRLSWSDWQPILTAVSANRSSLHTLVFLDKWKERAYTQLTGACVCVCVCVCGSSRYQSCTYTNTHNTSLYYTILIRCVQRSPSPLLPCQTSDWCEWQQGDNICDSTSTLGFCVWMQQPFPAFKHRPQCPG